MKIIENKLIVKVRLKGKANSIFEDALIDTGATFTVIPPDVEDFLVLDSYKKNPKIGLTTASGLIEVPVKILEEVELEGIKIKKLPVVIHKIPDPAPIKILLGMNFLQEIKIKIDGKENKFEIEDP